ncbi:hypothetical protein PHYPSEUDO_005718 [Phytophthora pseudosyringae]|uniref:Uncharacterized protein n=1 Tax=Phytophthora pseudosyringae TaxID=221518 RepID=A0A8T1VNH6_9STRA|nr:hypothetical protein PHYPSEUDO_005718 [Phytophthora pseudosyringae]
METAVASVAQAAAAMDKAQAFAHRLVEFADYDKCVKYFTERQIDFDRPNVMGWSVLMSVCACGRDDLVGFVLDRTAAVDCATNSNWTTALHLTAMSKNTRVMEGLVATAERKLKLQKVLEQPNAHGDTALMLACVAKNVTAVLLLLELGASMDAVNASGLNALMGAARVGEDPRPGAPSIEEMMERSAAIVKVLLVNGANVNATERAGGNTALHLAVLSENPDAVEALIKNAPDLDSTLRNEVGKTALDLTRRISGVASAQMEDLLSVKWAQQEKEAAQRSAKMEQELMDQAVKDAEDLSDCTQMATLPKTGKKKNKRTNKKAKAVKEVSEASSMEASANTDDTPDDRKTEANIEDVAAGSTALVSGEEQTGQEAALAGPDQNLHEHGLEDDDGNWESVIPKKNRRKESVSDNAKAVSKRNTIKSQRQPSTNNKKSVQASSKPVTTPRQTAQEARPALTKEVTPASVAHKAPWASPPTSKPTKPSISASPRSQVTSEADEDESTPSSIPYEVLNGSFHRTFPVAAELEIDVEKFLIASSVSDRELEPNDSLSISQVEALQEAHWQAYHYLNEKKIELTRVLEAQRVEAQFALQQELMYMK